MFEDGSPPFYKLEKHLLSPVASVLFTCFDLVDTQFFQTAEYDGYYSSHDSTCSCSCQSKYMCVMEKISNLPDVYDGFVILFLNRNDMMAVYRLSVSKVMYFFRIIVPPPSETIFSTAEALRTLAPAI